MVGIPTRRWETPSARPDTASARKTKACRAARRCCPEPTKRAAEDPRNGGRALRAIQEYVSLRNQSSVRACHRQRIRSRAPFTGNVKQQTRGLGGYRTQSTTETTSRNTTRKGRMRAVNKSILLQHKVPCKNTAAAGVMARCASTSETFAVPLPVVTTVALQPGAGAGFDLISSGPTGSPPCQDAVLTSNSRAAGLRWATMTRLLATSSQ